MTYNNYNNNNGQQEYEKKSIHQVIKVSSSNSFVEVLDSAFEIGKVMFRFAEYDLNKPKGERFTKEILIYMDINEFDYLAYNIMYRMIDRDAINAREAQKKGGYKYCREIYTDLGGTTVEKLARQNRSRADNKPESRQLKIFPGEKYPWMLQAESGAGKMLETGLIAPDGKPDTVVRIPFSDKDFRKLAIAVTKELDAWRYYNRFLKEREIANRKKNKAV